MEECAEVTKVASKIYRFGQRDCAPGTSTQNKFHLASEIGDLFGVIDMMTAAGIELDWGIVDRYRSSKKGKILEFMDRERKA